MDEISRNISATRVRNNTGTHSFSRHKKNVKESCFMFLAKRRLATEQNQYEKGCSSVKTGNMPKLASGLISPKPDRPNSEK